MLVRPPTPSIVPAPPSLSSVAARVDDRIATLFATELARWRELDPDLLQPLGALRRFVATGGKRLRPAFCYWGFVAADGDPDDARVVDVGAAFELLHAFALVHDDVMDGSATRRGAPTTHVEFNDRHTAESWRGDGQRFGEGAAILVGDLAHVYADLLVDAVPQDETKPDVMAIWHELRLELNVGQYLDVLGTARGDRDPALARRITRYKSGKYTIERPLHVGSALAGRLDRLREPLSAYGDPLGEAFQLRDDVLGAFGDADLTGKPVGQDLQEGKPTPLLAAAYAGADGEQAALLDRVGAVELSEEHVAAVQQVLLSTGALDAVERRIAALTARAIDALDRVDLAPEARDALVELAQFVAYRAS